MANNTEHPLVSAVRLKKKSEKMGADKKFIARLDRIINERASEVAERFASVNFEETFSTNELLYSNKKKTF